MRLPWIRPFVLLLAAAPALSAAPALLRDLHPGLEAFPAELAAGGLTDAAGFHYFVAGDPAHGRELWRSDGTAAGTVRLTDVCPGPCPGAPVLLALAHGRVFFTADDGASGRELWSSGPDPNGSSAAERVRDLCPGPCGGDPASAALLGDDLYFLAWSAPQRVALWRSDGTRNGTRPVAEICASCTTLPSYGRFLQHISRFRNRVLFTGPDPEAELWESDGTAAGTFPVRQRFAFPPDPFGLTTAAFDDQRFFFVTGEGELFETDLTPEGTHLVRRLAEIVPVSDVVSISWIQASAFRDGRFFARVGGGLIASDGTHDGTILLQSFLHTHTLTVLSLEAAVLVVDGHRALYATGGTPETTVELLDLGDSHFLDAITQVGDRAFFIKSSRDGPQPARELWVTDGSAAGTRRIGGAPAGIQFLEAPLVPTPGPFYFVEGDDGGGTRLWRSDGGEAGTFPVHEFGDVPASGGPLAQARLAGKIVLSARTSATDAPLFTTDGTAAGTSVLHPADVWGRDFVRVGSQLVLNTVTPATPSRPGGGGSGIWRTDGTAAGTRRLSPGRVFSPTVFGGVLLYGAELSFSPAGSSELELFSTDGTRRGTGPLADINPFQSDDGINHGCYGASSDPGPGVVIRNRVVFAADDGLNGRELFVTDGTRRGTSLVRDINPGRIPGPPDGACLEDSRRYHGQPSSPESFVAYRSGALFTADDGRTGRELWWTDGTAEGTRRVRDLKPGPQGSSPHDLVAFGGKVYFFAATAAGTRGEVLWRTDGTAAGTAAGTVRVADLTLAGSPSWAGRPTPVGDKLFFTVYNEETGSELWVTRGDSASTRLVADLHPGPSGSAPQALTDIQGILVFAADDGSSGLEPWRSDGTAAGTRRLGDINPGPAASSPGPFDRVGPVILTGADDGVHGREPWVIPLADLLRP